MSEKPCTGRWDLFDSHDWADHLEARDLCATCPVMTKCHQLAVDMAASQRHRGPNGTWAGVLYVGDCNGVTWIVTAHDRREAR